MTFALTSTKTFARTLTTLLPLTILVLLASPLAATPNLGVQQLNVGGITLVQTATELTQHLGRPLTVHSTVDEATGERATLHLYPGLSVYLVGGEAMRVKATDPAHKTTAGARVGDRMERVLELYQPAQPAPHGKNAMGFRIEDSAAYLVFHRQHGRVAAIELRLDY